MTYDDVQRIALAWPGVEASTSYGTPALKVKGKLLARLKEDGDSLVLRGIDSDERQWLIDDQPEVFYITDHYRGWPMVLARLSKAERAVIERMLLRSWKQIAPRKLVQSFEGS